MAEDKEQMGTEDEPMPRDEQDLTPPHGDELRSEETFGRTDRYSNVDDEVADRTEESNDVDRRAPRRS